ncbi:MAG TPA: PaaI family thioesterase [Candidatus Lokiarchaeia archaeon]|nr:PaaI family thioesterase [Candidatus Lokiarchaeia archaeon]
MSKADSLREYLDGTIPMPPIAQVLGIRFTGFDNGTITMEMDVDDRLYNPMNTLHGGVYCDIADASMGFAFYATLADDEAFTTQELHISYFLPVTSGKLIATSNVVHRGARIGHIECDLTNEAGALVARASSTCMVLKARL